MHGSHYTKFHPPEPPTLLTNAALSPSPQVCDLCCKYENPPDIAKALIDESLKKGANDNMTGKKYRRIRRLHSGFVLTARYSRQTRNCPTLATSEDPLVPESVAVIDLRSAYSNEAPSNSARKGSTASLVTETSGPRPEIAQDVNPEHQVCSTQELLGGWCLVQT